MNQGRKERFWLSKPKIKAKKKFRFSAAMEESMVIFCLSLGIEQMGGAQYRVARL